MVINVICRKKTDEKLESYCYWLFDFTVLDIKKSKRKEKYDN